MIINPQQPIFVTGIERSGSTIIAKIIDKCGAFTGQTTAMMENKELKRLVDVYYVYDLKLPIFGQKPLPNTHQLKIPVEWKEKVEYTLEKQDYTIPWMYKSNRLAQIWPVWNQAFPDAKWIIVRRRTGDIVQSCLKTGFMNAYQDAEGWKEWIHEHERLFVEMIGAGINYKEVWPERMVTGDYSQINEMLEWLGLEWNDGIVGMVEGLLKNSIVKERSI